MVLFVWRLCYTDYIPMIDIRTDHNKLLKIKKNTMKRIYRIYWFLDSKYRTGFETPAPANPINYYVR